MTFLRKLVLSLVAAVAALALSAAPSGAVVGGSDAGGDEFPSVAEVVIAKGFLCTGTLIAPDTVLSAGHCGSITGGTGVASPAAYPPQLIDVYIGSNKPGQGERVPVSRVTTHPDYFLGAGYDIVLLKLSRPSTKTPTPVSGAAEESLWGHDARDDRRLRRHGGGRRSPRHAAEGAGADHDGRVLRGRL